MNTTELMRRKRSAVLIGIALFFSLALFSYSQTQHYIKFSVKDYQDFSRVIIQSSFPLVCEIEKSPPLLLVKMGTDVSFQVQQEPFESRLIKSLGWTKGKDYYFLTIQARTQDFSYKYFTPSDPPQLIIDFSANSLKVSESKDRYNGDGSSTGERALIPDASSLSRTRSLPSSIQGMRTIIIDPGHGGLEAGAKGKFGTLEKEITLAISRKLKGIIERNLDFRIVLTRNGDVNVSLENRAALANNNRSYLFISIHTNSSYRKEARGSETFFLNLNATDEEARRLAYLENNSTEFEEKITGDDKDNLEMILWDMAQAAYLKQSSQLAENIQRELNVLLGTANRGVKQAPFKVLTGVACPAVLVEVAFLSNPEEERKLLMDQFQSNVALAIYRGLVNFIRRYSQE